MDEINYLGNIRGDKPQGYTGSVYLSDGIAPTILSRDYKDPALVVVEVKNEGNKNTLQARQDA